MRRRALSAYTLHIFTQEHTAYIYGQRGTEMYDQGSMAITWRGALTACTQHKQGIMLYGPRTLLISKRCHLSIF
jgi:hypothetical protein